MLRDHLIFAYPKLALKQGYDFLGFLFNDFFLEEERQFWQACFSATFIISSGIGRLQSVSVKDRSSKIADAIPSSRSLTSAAFR